MRSSNPAPHHHHHLRRPQPDGAGGRIARSTGAVAAVAALAVVTSPGAFGPGNRVQAATAEAAIAAMAAANVVIEAKDIETIDPDKATVDLPMRPSISPDGKEIAFTWRGDLWKASIDGGEAVRLTSHQNDDLSTAWSADGDRIAFISDRDGYFNIYTMKADGTDIVQVTNLDATHDLTGYGVDEHGDEVLLFAGRLEGDVYRADRPYMVSSKGGMARRVHGAYGDHPVVSPDGNLVVFTRGASSWNRRHYRGPDNRDVWVYDRGEDSFKRLTEWEGNDGEAKWIDNDTILYLSDRQLDTVNIYRRDIDKDENSAKRLTSFRNQDVYDFDVSADGKTVVLHCWDRFHVLDLTESNPEPTPIYMTAPTDERDQYRLQSVNREVSEAALSPDGQVMAMVAHGEVFIRNIEDKSPTIRVTRNASREKDITWSPDGVKLYFVSDEDGSDSIHAASVDLTRSEVKEEFEKRTGRKVVEPAEEVIDNGKTSSESEAGGAAPAEPAADAVSGEWSGEARGASGEVISYSMTLELAEDGRSVIGTLDAMGFIGDITGTWELASRQLQLTASIPDGPTITMDLTVGDNTLTGTANAGGEPYDTTATREAPAAAPAAAPSDAPAASDNDDAENETKDDTKDEPLPKELDPKRWHDAIRFNVEPVIADPDRQEAAPQFSPDGRYLSFRRGLGDIVLYDLETNEERMLVSGWDDGINWRWRPDGKYIAYAQNDLNFNSDIWIVPVDGSKEPVNISRHPDSDSAPRWSADGKVLTFTSERENDSWNLYAVYLDKDLEALNPKELDAYYENAVKEAKKRKPLEPKRPAKEEGNSEDAEEDDEKATDDASEEAVEEEGAEEDPATDFEDAYLRLRMVVRDSVSGWQNEMTPGGDRYIFSAGGLQSVKWDGSDRKSLGSGSMQHLSVAGDKLVVVSGGRAGVVNPNGGSVSHYDIEHEMKIDRAEQSSQKFLEAARIVGENFYHPTMKGLNWDALTERYHDLARRAHTSTEFNTIADRLLGELNGSHLGIRAPSDTSSPIRQSHGRLGTVHHRVDAGFRITEIIPESPAAKGPMALMIGDVITAINFEPFTETDTIESRLEGKVNEEVVLTINRTIEDDDTDHEESGEPVELHLFITPTSSGAERGLRYDAWCRENARLVDEWSDGRFGYIHIEGMNQPSLNVFERDLYAAAEGKDGLIVDVRNNGGGWTADRLLASIMVQPHAYTIPRGADPKKAGHYPQDRLFIQRYTLPMNMLANEKSFSNAEIVAHAFKTLDRGTLVGQQTYGGVISTGGTRLIDGTFVRIPFRGWYLPDGTDMENNGAKPDVLVVQTPESEAKNEDIQLRAAVDDLLKRLN